MMNTFCFDSHKDWDNRVRMLLLTVREAFQESLCVIPFELVFGHSMGGPGKILKDKFVKILLLVF
jgi:hypothetical protein